MLALRRSPLKDWNGWGAASDACLDSALRAIEYGAFRYLVKPIEPPLLDEVVRRAAKLHHMAQLKRQSLEAQGHWGRAPGDRAEGNPAG